MALYNNKAKKNNSSSLFLHHAVAVTLFIMLCNLFSPVSSGVVPVEEWTVFCSGAADPTGTWEVLRFFPQDLTINAGDSITFICFHAHTVTFGNYTLVPPIQNPQTLAFNPYYTQIDPSGNFSVTDPNQVISTGFIVGVNVTFHFPVVGVFPYQCILHGTMIGTITVQAAGLSLPIAPSEVFALGQQAIANVSAQVPGIIAAGDYNRTVAPSSPSASGHTSWTVLVGGGSATYWLTYPRFIPSTVTVNVGDTVAFNMNDRIDIHIVAFNTSCVYNTDDTQLNATTVIGNPNYWKATGNPTGYPTTSTFISSGVLIPIPGQWFNVTFTQSGTYCYICSLHPGMVGTVIVNSQSSSSASSALTPFNPFDLF